MTPQLGPRASFLLGMLAHPRTDRELLRLVRDGSRLHDENLLDDDLYREGYAVCGEIAAGGHAELDRLLKRLERFGFAASVPDPEGHRTLWASTLASRQRPA